MTEWLEAGRLLAGAAGLGLGAAATTLGRDLGASVSSFLRLRPQREGTEKLAASLEQFDSVFKKWNLKRPTSSPVAGEWRAFLPPVNGESMEAAGLQPIAPRRDQVDVAVVRDHQSIVTGLITRSATYVGGVERPETGRKWRFVGTLAGDVLFASFWPVTFPADRADVQQSRGLIMLELTQEGFDGWYIRNRRAESAGAGYWREVLHPYMWRRPEMPEPDGWQTREFERAGPLAFHESSKAGTRG